MSSAASPPGALRPPHAPNSGDVCEASPSAHSQTESSVVASVHSGNQAAAAAAHPASSMSRTLEKYQPGASFFSAPEVTLTTAAQPGSKGDVADEPHAAPQRIGWWQRTRNTVEVVREVVRRQPGPTLVPPLLVLVVLMVLGVTGTLLGASAAVDSQKDIALSISLDTAVSFKLSVEQTFAPLITLNSFIQIVPNATELQESFPRIARGLLEEVPSITNLQYSPFGFIKDEVPWANHTGIDIFNTSSLRPGAINTLQLRTLVLSGPLDLVGGGGLSGIARLPIYVPNVSETETFGNPVSGPTNVPMDLQYNNDTRTKFWGFVTAIIGLYDLVNGSDSRLQTLKSKGYRYQLTRPGDRPGDPPFPFGQTSPPATDCQAVSTTFNVTNNQWTLSVCSGSGSWEPLWKWPVVAAVVVLSVVMALMVFVMMVSLKQQTWLLGEMVAINSQLADTTHNLEVQKAQHEAMLVRQYNLINCFANPHSARDVSMDESTTMERIEAVRRQLNTENVKNLADTEQIQTLEVLGEGTFGKVYKGLWRGTEVAVKTMVLPANMTGQEKREKMAVMEAAISSSLAHPNVVATYTYSIKPVRDTTTPQDNLDTTGMVLMGRSTIGNVASPPDGPSKVPSIGDTAMGNVHSFEVRLVLEFCDKGCLREALDAGAFYCSTGLNYRAILDTALDIAKAMCHLHAMNVLHSDLKARNVMLKSSGDSRGITAKVADFGLSVKMDQSETHMSNLFQGTMTHMAPEIMLEGRVSKAADVYAFGITLWELFTAGHPFQGTPRALMGHLITREHKRPTFSPATPTGYRELAERCWAPNQDTRPGFEEILQLLCKLRAEEAGPTPPVVFNAPSSGHGVGPSNGHSAPQPGNAELLLTAAVEPASSSPNLSPAAAKLGSGLAKVGRGAWGTTLTKAHPVLLPVLEGEDGEHMDSLRAQSHHGTGPGTVHGSGQGTGTGTGMTGGMLVVTEASMV